MISLILPVLFSSFAYSLSGATTSGQCPNIPFETVIYSQCPVFKDLRCAPSMTRAKIGPHAINCGLIEPTKDPEMRIINATEFFNILQETDPFDRPICSVVMFYSPSCVFSRRVAGYVYLLAKLFPQLQIYAVNLHSRSSLLDRLINQHGVVATPIIILYENSIAKVRLYDENSSLRSLTEIILRRTDLRLPPGVKLEELSQFGVAEEHLKQEYAQFINQFFDFEEMVNGIDRYFIAACIVLLVNMTYFLHYSFRVPQLWPALQNNL